MRWVPPVAGVYRGLHALGGERVRSQLDVGDAADLCELFTVNRFDDPVLADRAGRRPGWRSSSWRTSAGTGQPASRPPSRATTMEGLALS